MKNDTTPLTTAPKRAILSYALERAFFHSSLSLLYATPLLPVFWGSSFLTILLLLVGVFLSIFALIFFGTLAHWYTYKRVHQEKEYWDEEEFLERY